jgi:hypothetical protein
MDLGTLPLPNAGLGCKVLRAHGIMRALIGLS